MAREPSYPKDAPVGQAKGDSAAAPAAPAAASESRPADSKRTKHLVTGAAIGIGSAAIVAALLYANRNRGGR
ncbi:MAG: hypothetical protein QOH81_1632 [Sphingomonadales bacterium]|jgi:hypothetical protein|nr:hypothetical protein [Sphingomonadales bacterium]